MISGIKGRMTVEACVLCSFWRSSGRRQVAQENREWRKAEITIFGLWAVNTCSRHTCYGITMLNLIQRAGRCYCSSIYLGQF